MKTLLLFDANSIIHRSFHALPPFTAPDGQPSGALYGIASILLKLWREERPDYAAALFDRPEPTFREKKYKEYKAQRPPAADDLISQIVEAHRLFEAFGIHAFESPGYEADDLIATFAEHFGGGSGGLRVVILTGDRDTLQLVQGEAVVVRIFNKGISDTTVYDENAVKEKYGLSPDQIIDYKALVGDPSDNIKGVPGVGPKTATEALKRFGTLKDLYAYVEKAAKGGDPSGDDERLVKRFGPFRGDAELSLDLVTLDRRVPIAMPQLADIATAPVPPGVEAYFEAMGFATLLRRMASDGERAKEGADSRRGKNARDRSGPTGQKTGTQGRMF